MQNVIDQFREALHVAGLNPPPVITADGRLHRFPSNGKANDDAAWFVLHGDGIPAGAFGDWRMGISQNWRTDIGRRLSPQEEAHHTARMAAVKREREAEEAKRRAAAKVQAKAIWDGAEVTGNVHEYLNKKGVASHGLREQDGALLVPLFDGENLQSLQYIHPNGEKRFLTAGRVAGCYFLIGSPLDMLCIAEGYATAASIHQATGYAVAVAFNAGNLLAASQGLKKCYPFVRLIICGDDDFMTVQNPGLTKARAAAEAVGGFLAVPEFGEGRPDWATDFNDLHQLKGLESVSTCLEKAMSGEKTSLDDAWPTPKPIKSELKTVPAFDAEKLLPCVLRNWVMDEAERMSCPPDFIAVSALVALGSIIGARCAIKPKARDSWFVIPNLWGGIVGDPSAKKSPAWGAALRPMDALTKAAREVFLTEQKDFETQKIVFEAERNAIEDQIKKAARKPSQGDPKTFAMNLRAHEDGAPEAPTLRRFKTNDSTVEKLGELLRENPTGILVLRDELVGLLSSWDREGHEGDRAFFLEGWNGNQQYDTDRIGRGHISIPNLCISIFGGIQPDKLTGYLEQAAYSLANDGMLQRFQLLVYPDKPVWQWCDRAPNKPARDAADRVFERIANFDPIAWGALPADETGRFPFFRFDEEAQEVFIEWSTILHRERMPREEEPIIHQHLAKFDKLFPALALIFHLVDCAANGKPGSVTQASAQRAWDWCEYLELHARRCYGLLLDEGQRAAQALAKRLKRGDLENGFTSREVRRKQWRSLNTESAVHAALDWLEADGWLRSESRGGTGPGSGRQTLRYSINPAIKGANMHSENDGGDGVDYAT